MLIDTNHPKLFVIQEFQYSFDIRDFLRWMQTESRHQLFAAMVPDPDFRYQDSEYFFLQLVIVQSVSTSY